MIISDISEKQSFEIMKMTPRETLGLRCVQINQLMTYPAVYTLPFPL